MAIGSPRLECGGTPEPYGGTAIVTMSSRLPQRHQLSAISAHKPERSSAFHSGKWLSARCTSSGSSGRSSGSTKAVAKRAAIQVTWVSDGPRRSGGGGSTAPTDAAATAKLSGRRHSRSIAAVTSRWSMPKRFCSSTARPAAVSVSRVRRISV